MCARQCAGSHMLRGPPALLPQQPARLRHHCRALPLGQGQRLGELCAVGLQGVSPGLCCGLCGLTHGALWQSAHHPAQDCAAKPPQKWFGMRLGIAVGNTYTALDGGTPAVERWQGEVSNCRGIQLPVQVPATKTSSGRNWIPFIREPEMAIN